MQETNGFFRKRLGASFFSKPPLKSPYFWSNTIFLLGLIGFVAIVWMRVGEKLNLLSKVWMVMCVIALGLLWERVRSSHQRISDAYAETTTASLQEPLSGVFASSAKVCFFGFQLALWAAFAGMMSLMEVIAPTRR